MSLEEHLRCAAVVARLLRHVNDEPDLVEEGEEEPSEKPEAKGETVDAMREFAAKQKRQPLRVVEFAEMGLNPANVRKHNASMIRNAVIMVMMLGTNASSAYSAAEAGTLTIFRGTIYGSDQIPPEVLEAVRIKNEMIEASSTEKITVTKRSTVHRVSAEEVVLVRDTAEIIVEDNSSS